jgi:hypothetical protein
MKITEQLRNFFFSLSLLAEDINLPLESKWKENGLALESFGLDITDPPFGQLLPLPDIS